MSIATPWPVGQRPQHPAHGALAVDHAVAGALAQGFEQRVQAGVVERPGQHADRLEEQRVHDGVQLPEAEVAGEEQHALPLA